MEFWEQVGLPYETLEILRLKRHTGATAAELGHYLAARISEPVLCETGMRVAFFGPDLFRRVRPWWHGDIDDAALDRDVTSTIERTRRLWNRDEDERL